MHLFIFFVRQICGPIVGFHFYSTYVWRDWKWPKWAPPRWEFPRTECGNCWRPSWEDFPSPGGCLLFQKVHELILLTRTCSVCSSIQIVRIKTFLNFKRPNSPKIVKSRIEAYENIALNRIVDICDESLINSSPYVKKYYITIDSYPKIRSRHQSIVYS